MISLDVWRVEWCFSHVWLDLSLTSELHGVSMMLDWLSFVIAYNFLMGSYLNGFHSFDVSHFLHLVLAASYMLVDSDRCITYV